MLFPSDLVLLSSASGHKNNGERIFCLCVADTERYFKTNHERQCRITEHARKQDKSHESGNGSEDGGSVVPQGTMAALIPCSLAVLVLPLIAMAMKC